MKEFHGKINGDYIVNEDLALHGMIAGKTTVNPSTFLKHHGTIIGDLILLENSEVELHGTVNGNVINDGGELKIFGMINGNLIKNAGNTMIAPNAVIKNTN